MGEKGEVSKMGLKSWAWFPAAAERKALLPKLNEQLLEIISILSNAKKIPSKMVSKLPLMARFKGSLYDNKDSLLKLSMFNVVKRTGWLKRRTI